MRYIVDSIEMAFVVIALCDNEDITQCGDVAIDIAVGRVDEALSVDRQTIGIQLGCEWGCGDGPYAIRLFDHRQLLIADFCKIAVHAHRLCSGIVEVERH